MKTQTAKYLWQVPLTLLACIGGSLAAVAAMSTVAGFTMDPALVVVLSAVLGGVAIAREIHAARQHARAEA